MRGGQIFQTGYLWTAWWAHWAVSDPRRAWQSDALHSTCYSSCVQVRTNCSQCTRFAWLYWKWVRSLPSTDTRCFRCAQRREVWPDQRDFAVALIPSLDLPWSISDISLYSRCNRTFCLLNVASMSTARYHREFGDSYVHSLIEDDAPAMVLSKTSNAEAVLTHARGQARAIRDLKADSAN